MGIAKKQRKTHKMRATRKTRKTSDINKYISMRKKLINDDLKQKFEHHEKGGKPIASGGFGCVFEPPIKCKNKRIEKNSVSKLMLSRHANSEMRIIERVKKVLVKIPYYGDYFIVKDTFLCNIVPLTKKDKEGFNRKCNSLVKKNITAKNINSNLNKIKAITMYNGGIDIDKYWKKWNNLPDSKKKRKLFGITNISLIQLLSRAIQIMNKLGLYHLDIKGGNIMHSINNRNIYDVTNIKTRLIDWGLSMTYTHTHIPFEIMDRPFQYNLPFSSIIFQTKIQTELDNYIKKINVKKNVLGDNNNRNLMIDTLAVKIYDMSIYNDGEGHISYITFMIDKIYKPLYNNNITIAKKIICDYIAAILQEYMNNNYKLDLEKYFKDVFLHNVDIWGFIVSYFNLLTLENLQQDKFQTIIADIIIEYLYSTKYATNKIPIKELINRLLQLNTYLGEPFRYKELAYNNIKIM